MSPFVSVIMPTYNGEKFVSAALESICTEGSDGLEVLVLDDGSTDHTLDIIREFANRLPIRLISSRRTGNWVAMTNLGLREAAGEWVSFLHQDDLWLPGRLAKLRRAASEVEGALLIHNSMYVGPDGERLGLWTCPLSESVISSDDFLEHLLVQNFIAMPSPLCRRTAVVDSGGMDETLWYTADWDLWLRLGALGPITFIPETLSAFRIHSESQTISRKILPGEWEQQLITVLERHLVHWKVNERRRVAVKRVAMASVKVNSALSAAARGESFEKTPLLLSLFTLGPFGWHRYIKDSRILQRVGARIRLETRGAKHQSQAGFNNRSFRSMTVNGKENAGSIHGK